MKMTNEEKIDLINYFIGRSYNGLWTLYRDSSDKKYFLEELNKFANIDLSTLELFGEKEDSKYYEYCKHIDYPKAREGIKESQLVAIGFLNEEKSDEMKKLYNAL